MKNSLQQPWALPVVGVHFPSTKNVQRLSGELNDVSSLGFMMVEVLVGFELEMENSVIDGSDEMVKSSTILGGGKFMWRGW